MSTHYFQNVIIAICDAQRVEGGNKRMILFVGDEAKYFPVLCFRSCPKFFDLKNVGSSIFNVGLWNFLGGHLPEAIRVLKGVERMWCSIWK